MTNARVPEYQKHTEHCIQWNCVRFAAGLLVLCVLCNCAGCRTQSPWKLAARSVGYSDEEVLSRTWTNRDGRVMEVIDSVVRRSKRFGDFLVVKVGDRRVEEAFFCEIYLIKRVPAKQQVDTSRAELPMKLVPEHNMNAFLSRTGLDSGSFIIGGIAMREESNKVVFSIDQRAKHQYYWRQSEYSRRVPEPWEGGVIQTLTLTRDYEPNWTSWTYSGPPQLALGDR